MPRTKFHDGWTVGPYVSVFSDISGGSATDNEVALPHDAMLGLPRSADASGSASLGYFEDGAVVYRKWFSAPAEWRSRVIELEFQGVYRDAMVYLNDVLIGQRPNGYSAFHVRLDDALRYGEKNHLRVDARSHRDSRWYSGMGIHRDVELLDMPLTHLKPNGIRIATPDIEAAHAVVEIKTDVTNDGLRPTTVRVHSRIVNNAGAEVAAEVSPATVRPGHTATVSQRLYVKDPELWHPETPTLYRLESQLIEDGTVTDTAKHTFGIRRLQLDPVHGLRINGKEIKLRGACIHHDNGILGAVSVPEAEFRRVRILKSAGFNAIRSAHNPISPALLDACDQLGMLVMDEAFDMWTQGKQPFDYSLVFSEWWERDLEAMVARDFNHPSVIVYSIGNEILDAGKPLGAALGRQLAQKVRSLDSTRFLTNGISGFVATLTDIVPLIQRELAGIPGGINNVEGAGKAAVERVNRSQFVTDATEESHSVVDIAGHNYGSWRYETEHQQFPNRIVVGSETTPKDIAVNWSLVTRLPYAIGDFTWTGWDYLGEAGLGHITYSSADDPKAGDAYPALLAYCGDIDITGFRRPASYYREIVFGRRGTPYIAVHRPVPPGLAGTGLDWAWPDSQASWTWDCPHGTPLTVDVYSDADEVELLRDGHSLGTAPAGPNHQLQASFVVPYAPGALKAVAIRGGKAAESVELETAGEAVAVRAQVESPEQFTAGDYRYVQLDIADAAGRTVATDERRLSVNVSEGAILAGLGTARPVTEESFQSGWCTTFEGRALAVVRASGGAPATLTVSAEGLPSVSCTL